MKGAGEARSECEKPLPILGGMLTWRTMPFGLLAATLITLLAGCEAPQVDVSGTAATLRASATKRLESPAPRPPERLTVDRAIAETLEQRPEIEAAAAAYDARVAQAMLRRAPGQFAGE